MRFLKNILLFVLILFPLKITAQDANLSAEQIIADIYEQLAEDAETEIDFTNFYDDLIALAENPINLNSTNKDELDKLAFLSDVQIDNILHYLYRNTPIHTLYELQLIDGLDMTDIRRMLHFVQIGDAVSKKEKLDIKQVFKYGKNEVYFRLDRGLELREGYRYLPETDEKAVEANSKKYLGDPFYNHLKYRFRYRDKIQFGFTTEKDPGEQFWGKHNKGYDFYSAFFELKNVGRLKTLVLGDFRANFGQGLVMRTDFSMGKSAYVMQVTPRSSGLKKFSSTAEYDIFRGAGATVNLGKLDVTAFYSRKRIDGNTKDDTFTSLTQTGIHRTLNELNKKNAVLQQVIGGNATFTHQWFQIGATAFYNHFDHSLQPDSTRYNQFYFRGKEQWAASVNYRARWQKINFFGETAITDKSALATLNGMNFNPTSRVSLVALHRYFSKEYDVLFARTFSEASRVNNETGFYIGTEVRPIKYWKVSAYVDSYRFPWAKYNIDAPSIGRDYLVQIDYFPRRNINMYWRFKLEEKARNFTDTVSTMPIITNQTKWQARYLLNYTFGRFSFRNQLDANSFQHSPMQATYGFSALQDIAYNFKKIPLHINARFQIFDAQNYNNRIYVYERDVLYAFSIPMNYGLGSRYYLNLQYELDSKLTFWLKLAQTVYADGRTSQSSGNEEIQGNRKTDFRFLVRWKF